MNLIYTFIVGKYDKLRSPRIITPGWDYVCFTDSDKLVSDIWDIKKIPKKNLTFEDPKRNAVLLKIEYYEIIKKKYNVIVSIDSSVQINNNLNDFLDLIEIENYDIAMMKHDQRQCVYLEAFECKCACYDFPKVINKQMREYRAEKYPKMNGLWETKVVVRNQKRDLCRKAFSLWGEFYRKGSRRDQLSVNYSFWRAQQNWKGLKINTISKRKLFPLFFKSFRHRYGGHLKRINHLKKLLKRKNKK